jgi:hypothetical protein
MGRRACSASVSLPTHDRTPRILASMLVTAVFIGVKVTAVRASFTPLRAPHKCAQLAVKRERAAYHRAITVPYASNSHP